MKITNEFLVGAPVERAWAVLTDLEQVVPLMPGAEMVGWEGEKFLGRIKVKVGPVTSQFSGSAVFVERDDEARRAVFTGSGRDTRGAGNASATVTLDAREEGDKTRVGVVTDLKIVGKLAQFGSGMIEQVSEKLLDQFVAALERKLAAEVEGAGSAGHGETDGSAGERETVESAAGQETAGAAAGAGTAASAGSAGTAEASAAAESSLTPTASETEALDLMKLISPWQMFKQMMGRAGRAVVGVVTLRRFRRRDSETPARGDSETTAS